MCLFNSKTITSNFALGLKECKYDYEHSLETTPRCVYKTTFSTLTTQSRPLLSSLTELPLMPSCKTCHRANSEL
jgi:hypothetical protein